MGKESSSAAGVGTLASGCAYYVYATTPCSTPALRPAEASSALKLRAWVISSSWSLLCPACLGSAPGIDDAQSVMDVPFGPRASYFSLPQGGLLGGGSCVGPVACFGAFLAHEEYLLLPSRNAVPLPVTQRRRRMEQRIGLPCLLLTRYSQWAPVVPSPSPLRTLIHNPPKPPTPRPRGMALEDWSTFCLVPGLRPAAGVDGVDVGWPWVGPQEDCWTG
mmetsp:Transcript_63557/g.113454  ORF Transcript_63557/g.113454 Transcript_63557/m.113454 type:complete len:219 (+) Transcript_63557:1317-1973(+)